MLRQPRAIGVPVNYRPSPATPSPPPPPVPPPHSAPRTPHHRAVVAPVILSTIAVFSIVSLSAYVAVVNRKNSRLLATEQVTSGRLTAEEVQSQKIEAGSITSTDSLTVKGPSQFNGITNDGSLTQNGTAVFNGTLTQESGDSELKGALTVGGQTTLGALKSQAANLASLNVGGATTAQSLTVKSGLTVSAGGLTVSGGGTSLAGNLSVIGDINGLTVKSGVVSGGTWQGAAVASQYGGTGLNSSSATGVPSVAAGTWSIASLLGVASGGTGLNTTTSTGVPTIS
ncbi:MAG: hypothetical protein AAB499_00585, partial [Patescibacteria group bacterium]